MLSILKQLLIIILEFHAFLATLLDWSVFRGLRRVVMIFVVTILIIPLRPLRIGWLQ